MRIVLRFLLISTFVFLQACKHADENTEPEIKKTDLTKAASYNMQLGLGYLKQGDRPRAKKKLLTAMEQEPNSADVNAAMAYYFEQTNELDEAKKYYLKAISLSSGGGAQLNNYGTFLCRQGDYQKAETYFLKAVKDVQYINTSAAYENAGLCALAIPDNDKAKLYFTNALDQDPSRKESLYELVKLESKMGHDAEAYSLLQNHPDLVLNDRYFLALAKDIAIKTGNYAVAAEYENNFRKMETTTDNSGANNEYNSHNG
ncbi:type IV pilus assembly protein PilF [Legionella quateirensis]|uniref:Fimbrial biogenesis and twitching motility protein PilF n=1 Tax=Legionella quateirensis TaxID=45072 RepID=A0A378KSE9_9GAMM|nr:fimbrial biogenesis and twitching motility protein PilF [Legionella quateirensis]STY17804.1 type IV pilus assembly protein PilF [Legionella quateirensis]